MLPRQLTVAHKGHGKKMGRQRAMFFETAHKGHRSHGKFSRKHRCKHLRKHHGTDFLLKNHGEFGDAMKCNREKSELILWTGSEYRNGS